MRSQGLHDYLPSGTDFFELIFVSPSCWWFLISRVHCPIPDYFLWFRWCFVGVRPLVVHCIWVPDWSGIMNWSQLRPEVTGGFDHLIVGDVKMVVNRLYYWTKTSGSTWFSTKINWLTDFHCCFDLDAAFQNTTTTSVVGSEPPQPSHFRAKMSCIWLSGSELGGTVIRMTLRHYDFCSCFCGMSPWERGKLAMIGLEREHT